MQTQDFDDNYVNDVYNGKASGAMNQAPIAQPDTGLTSLQQQSTETNAGANMSFTEGLTKGLAGTSEADIANLYTRHSMPVDPEFNLKDNQKQIMDGLPLEYWGQFQSTRSLSEAMELKSQIQKDLQTENDMSHAGYTGYAGYALGSLLDPVNLLGGELVKSAKVLGVTSKIGLAGTRTESILANAEAGAKLGVAQGAISNTFKPTGNYSDIVNGGLMGAELGGLSGAVFHAYTGLHDVPREQFDNAIADTKKEFNESVAEGHPSKVYNDVASNPDKVFDTAGQQKEAVGDLEQQMADLEVKHDTSTNPEEQAQLKDQMMKLADRRIAQLNNHEGLDSVGAAAVGTTGIPLDVSLAQQKMIDAAHDYLDSNNIKSDTDASFPNTPMGNAAKRMYNAVQNTPFKTDFDRLFHSDSVVAQALTHKLYESAVGIFRNNKSVSMLQDIYTNNIAHSVLANYPRLFNKWAADQKFPVHNYIAYNTAKYRTMFENAVHDEREARLFDGKSIDNVHPSIKELVDHIDESSANAANLLKGREGETPVRGAENLQPRKGWFPQKWNGAKMNDVLASMAQGSKFNTMDWAKNKLAKTLADQYQIMHGFKPEEALQFAKAVIRRAISKDEGIDTNVQNLLNSEGSDYMREFLIDSGIPKQRVEELIDSLLNNRNAGNKESFLKARIDMDSRTPIPGTTKTLRDLMNTDITSTWNSYSRRAAGSAALARQGIQRGDFKTIFNTINAELRAKGKPELDQKFIDGVQSQFQGGAINGGVNDWVRRATGLTNLSILNGLGLTKLAEAGVNVAALGTKTFMTTFKKELSFMRNGEQDIQAMKDLQGWLNPIEGEHMVVRHELMNDELSKDPDTYNQLGRYTDALISKGARLQGNITGFYKVQQMTQRIAIRGMMHKLGEFYKDGTLISERRLEDMGLDAETSDRIGKYFKDGTVEYDADGGVKALNPDKWNPTDMQDFAVVLNRFTNQVVQRAMKGEDSLWMHSTVGSVFSALKRFTFDSLQKQLVRNMRIADPVSMHSFTYGLATAASVYLARQILNGNTKKQNPIDVAKGALTLSNMTSIVPAFVDPIASMLGMTSMKVGESGNDDYGILPIPPMFDAVNRMAKAPASLARMLTGTNNNADVYNAQAIPIIGNFVGMSNIWNEFKTTPATKPEVKQTKEVKPQVIPKQEIKTVPETKQTKSVTIKTKTSDTDAKGKKVLKDLGAGQ